MATIDRLTDADGPLTDLTVPLGRHEFQERWVYAFPAVVDWIQNELPNLAQGRLNADMTPQDQFYWIMKKWITGREIRYERMFKDLTPMRDEVWEMKTADIRLFGWMCAPLRFVAVIPGYADDFKGDGGRNYESAKQAVIHARNNLDLDEPKIAKGTFDALVRV